MIDTDERALADALEEMEATGAAANEYERSVLKDAAAALRRLAQPDQSEPVGHIVSAYNDPIMAHVGMVEMLVDEASMPIGTKLYTHPDRTQAPGEVAKVIRMVGDTPSVNGIALDELFDLGKRYGLQVERDGKPRMAQVIEALWMLAKAAATTPPSVPGKGSES